MSSLPADSSGTLTKSFKGDHRIWWLAIVALLGLIVYLVYDPRVFPSASIDLKLPRDKVAAISRKWAEDLGYNKTKVISSTEFAFDSDAKTFLEYELGTSEANKLMREQIPIWSWRTRFCKEHEFEEFKTWISPSGKLSGLDHDIENNRVLPSLSKDAAQTLARQFIEERAGIVLTGYKLVRSAAYSQPHRTDYSFTWEDAEQDIKGARLRTQATVSGNLLTEFSYFLYIPESWERKFSTIRSWNNLLGSIASPIYTLLELISVFVFFWMVTANNIRWRFALVSAAVVTLIGAFDAFNNMSSIIDDYNTHNSFIGFILQYVVQTIAGMLPQFLSNIILIGAAEAVYRQSYPTMVSFENFFSRVGLRSLSVIKAQFLAYLLLGIELGWIVVYYLLGEHFHFWCPLGVDNYQILSCVFPFFSALAIGVSASVTEELMYRVLALSIVQKMTRNFWFANFFQAAAWAFMHSNYPQQPAYARGVELTIGGMFHGWILRRYGILPALISHYLFDAFLDVKPLFSSSEPILKMSALLPIIPFLLLAIWGLYRIRQAGASSEDTIINAALIQEKKVQSTDLQPHPHSGFGLRHILLSTRLRLVMFVLALASLSLALPLRHRIAVGQDFHTTISRSQALNKATQVLIAHKVQPKGKQEVAWLTDQLGGVDLQYVYENVKLKKTIEYADLAKQGLVWAVRFFKPLDPEEYEVLLDKNGNEFAFAVKRPEDAPGARLSSEAAKEAAEAHLTHFHAQFKPYEFDTITETKRKDRTDYSVTFKVPKLKVADADFKVTTNLIGDVVSGFSAGWDIPDDWLDQRNKKTTKDEVFSNIRIAFSLFILLTVLFWAFGILKAGHFNWRSAFLLATVFLLTVLIQDINELPQFFRNYDTTSPSTSYVIKELVNYLQAALSSFAGYVVVIAFAIAALRLVVPNFKLPLFLEFIFEPKDKESRQERRNIWLDSVLVAAAFTSVHLLIETVVSCLRSAVSPEVPIESLDTICSLANIFSPNLDFIGDMTVSGVSALLMVAIGMSLYKKYCRKDWMFFAILIFYNLISASSERYWQDYLIDVGSGCVTLSLVWLAVATLINLNPLTYFLIGAGDILFSRLFVIIDHGLPIFFNQSIFLLLLLLSPLIYVAILFAPNKSDGS
jgi:Type II CAAX prenyl endopeptidase Rce1-like